MFTTCFHCSKRPKTSVKVRYLGIKSRVLNTCGATKQCYDVALTFLVHISCCSSRHDSNMTPTTGAVMVREQSIKWKGGSTEQHSVSCYSIDECANKHSTVSCTADTGEQCLAASINYAGPSFQASFTSFHVMSLHFYTVSWYTIYFEMASKQLYKSSNHDSFDQIHQYCRDWYLVWNINTFVDK